MNLFSNFKKEKSKKTNEHSEIETWELVASGIVQGVGFRYSVQNCAQELNLNGSVKNNADSTVTIILQTNKAKVDDFLNILPNKISSFAKIENITVKKLLKMEKMHGFHVLY